MLDIKIEDGIEYKGKAPNNRVKECLKEVLIKMKEGQSFVCPKQNITSLRTAIKEVTALENVEHRDRVYSNTKTSTGDWRCFRLK